MNEFMDFVDKVMLYVLIGFLIMSIYSVTNEVIKLDKKIDVLIAKQDKK